MATMTCHYYSFSLKRNTDIEVFIPTPEGAEQITNDEAKQSYPYEKGLPVLYLLHGAYGDCHSWMRNSNIERYAQQHCIAIVTSSAGNSFYQDMAHGDAYYTFFTEELPAFITSIFPISKRREDTYIAGLSMGGYGAWYFALSRPDLYSYAASMSGALDLQRVYSEGKVGSEASPFPWNDIFDDPNQIAGSNSDIFYLYDKCVANGTVPKLYQACGKDDFLHDVNIDVRDRLLAKHADLVYEEGPGEHNWDFWDEYIKHILSWIDSQ